MEKSQVSPSSPTSTHPSFAIPSSARSPRRDLPLRVLYVASGVSPFLKISDVADFIHKLPLEMKARGLSVRILVPRFGLINERRNRLHEVVRLSGINISMGDQEKLLVIKVASIPNARLQVYFIDNEEYFRRKAVFYDKNETFFDDNDERAVFFCKSALATVRRLGWAPDIVHCTGWMTSLIPLYLKTTYRNDPILCNAKSVFSVDKIPQVEHNFSKKKLIPQVKMAGVDDEALAPLAHENLQGFTQIGISHADVVAENETHTQENKSPADIYYDMYCQLANVTED